MIQRVLNSKNFLAVLLALLTGTALYFKVPWPMTTAIVSQTWNEYFLRLIALRDPWTYATLKASYHIMLFTTPYIGFSFVLSALYIFTLRPRRAGKPQPLRIEPTLPRIRHVAIQPPLISCLRGLLTTEFRLDSGTTQVVGYHEVFLVAVLVAVRLAIHGK